MGSAVRPLPERWKAFPPRGREDDEQISRLLFHVLFRPTLRANLARNLGNKNGMSLSSP